MDYYYYYDTYYVWAACANSDPDLVEDWVLHNCVFLPVDISSVIFVGSMLERKSS